MTEPKVVGLFSYRKNLGVGIAHGVKNHESQFDISVLKDQYTRPERVMHARGDIVGPFMSEPGQKRPVPFAVVIGIFKPIGGCGRVQRVRRIVPAVSVVVRIRFLPEAALIIYRRDRHRRGAGQKRFSILLRFGKGGRIVMGERHQTGR